MIDRTFSFSSFFRKGSTLILAFFLFFGLLLGWQLQTLTDHSLILMMRASAVQSVSIVRSLTVLLLPFLLSAFCYSICTAWLIIPIVFLKGIIFGFCQAMICASFAGAGWLLYFFLMFSDILTLPVLIYFWLSCLEHSRHLIKQLLLCAILVAAVVLIDQHLISSYLAGLLN